jgi:hypothetical protein
LFVEGPTTGLKDEAGGRNIIVIRLMMKGGMKRIKKRSFDFLNDWKINRYKQTGGDQHSPVRFPS